MGVIISNIFSSFTFVPTNNQLLFQEFENFTECEMALSQLDLGPEWVFEPIEKMGFSRGFDTRGDLSRNEHR